jgi:hypothetical protein
MSELPDDLAELERRLAARPRGEPDAAFRQRLLASVSDELQRDRRRAANGAWRFAAALAAAVLLGAYLSMSAALNMDGRRGDDGGEITAAAKRLQQLDPDMSEQEARRQALMLHTRSHRASAPARSLRERDMLRLAPR